MELRTGSTGSTGSVPVEDPVSLDLSQWLQLQRLLNCEGHCQREEVLATTGEEDGEAEEEDKKKEKGARRPW